MAIGTALALGLGSVASGAIGARASNRAASSQANAATASARLQLQGTREQIAAQKAAQERIIALTANSRRLGDNALGQMLTITNRGFTPTDYTKSAAHEFQLSEGENAMSRMSSARGMSRSGAAMKDALRFSQGLGSQYETQHYNREFGEYRNRYNQLAGIANVGAGAQAQQVGAIQNSTNNITSAIGQGNALAGNAMMQAGNARASGYQGTANALQGILGDGAGILGMQQGGYFNNQSPLFANPFNSGAANMMAG